MFKGESRLILENPFVWDIESNTCTKFTIKFDTEVKASKNCQEGRNEN